MKLHVVLLVTPKTKEALCYENQSLPYGRRHIAVELTPEQAEALRPRRLGNWIDVPQYEEFGDVWLEDEPKKGVEK
jgi:hypothetical protein